MLPEVVVMSQSHSCCLSYNGPFQSTAPSKLEYIPDFILSVQGVRYFPQDWSTTWFYPMTAYFIPQRTVSLAEKGQPIVIVDC